MALLVRTKIRTLRGADDAQVGSPRSFVATAVNFSAGFTIWVLRAPLLFIRRKWVTTAKKREFRFDSRGRVASLRARFSGKAQ